MTRKKLAPHGSVGAVRRHQRASEPLCDDCAVFWRDYRREHRGQPSGALVEDLGIEDEAPDGFTLPEPLTELREHYAAVVAAMTSPKTPATAIASLSSRREALYSALQHAERQAELAAVVRDAAKLGDGEAAYQAVQDAGGTPLDALIARRQARAKPITTARTVEQGDGTE